MQPKSEVSSENLFIEHLYTTVNRLIQTIQFQRTTRIHDKNVVECKKYSQNDFERVKNQIFDQITSFFVRISTIFELKIPNCYQTQ